MKLFELLYHSFRNASVQVVEGLLRKTPFSGEMKQDVLFGLRGCPVLCRLPCAILLALRGVRCLARRQDDLLRNHLFGLRTRRQDHFLGKHERIPVLDVRVVDLTRG